MYKFLYGRIFTSACQYRELDGASFLQHFHENTSKHIASISSVLSSSLYKIRNTRLYEELVFYS